MIHTFRFTGRLLSTLLILTLPLSAKVSLEDHGKKITLNNGVVTATVDKSSASLDSIIYKNTEFVLPGHGNAYYSMDGGRNYRRPNNCTFRIHSQSSDHIDIAMLNTWTKQPQAYDVEIHYVIRDDDNGLYTYAILGHPEKYPETQVGEWRMVWKLPGDLLDTIAVDNRRNWQMPTVKDHAKSDPTDIKEISKINTGVRAEMFDCKYDFNTDYYNTPSWGHYDKDTGFGAWMVFGAHEWFNDGPTKQDLTSAANILHVHFGMNHYNGSVTHVAKGEKWEKIYGPFRLHLNHFPGNPKQTITDAREQVKKEKAQWPYKWLTSIPAYPSADKRGSVTGKFLIADPAKPSLTTENAWIGLAQPEADGNWQFESKHYQYWTHVKKDGTFTIPNVRPGTHTLYAFANGAVGEFKMDEVKVEEGKANSLGEIVWKIPRENGDIVWEIGVPDRSAAEFRHGNDYFHGYVWRQFAKEWPNPLEFTIGKSDPAKDWNFAQSSYGVDEHKLDRWAWNIHFTLSKEQKGDAVLTLAFASVHHARVKILVNDVEVASTAPSVQGGNALLRESIHAKYALERVTIPADKLKPDENKITLIQTRTDSPANHVMYDYLSLEMPTEKP